jgi:hypothetical protein
MLYDALYLLVCTPVPYLPLLFQGVSASDLPTKSIYFCFRHPLPIGFLPALALPPPV